MLGRRSRWPLECGDLSPLWNGPRLLAARAEDSSRSRNRTRLPMQSGYRSPHSKTPVKIALRCARQHAVPGLPR